MSVLVHPSTLQTLSDINILPRPVLDIRQNGVDGSYHSISTLIVLNFSFLVNR